MSERPEPQPGADDPDDRPPSLTERALDLLVFAPAGAVLSALEDVPGMAARGRAVIEQEVRNAHLIGQFAVGEGQRRLQRGIDRLTGSTDQPGAPGGVPPAEPRGGSGAGAPEAPVAEAPVAEAPVAEAPVAPPTVEPSVPAPSGTAVPDGGGVTADLAIPGYDTLSASQVVRRLDGLGPAELAAVFRHEAATRGRRTILHRAQQLLGPSGPKPPEA